MIDLDYYDKTLVGIGGSILGGVIIGWLTSIVLQFGVLRGTVVETLFVYDVLFRNPPLPATHPRLRLRRSSGTCSCSP